MEAFNLDAIFIENKFPVVESTEPVATDPRILNLSYSGLLILHSCPRKFQLSRLNAEKQEQEDINQSITFSFGHIVGHGIQLHFEGATEDQIIWQLFQEWECDLFAENAKQKKSFWLAIAAIQNFLYMRESGYLEDWELVYVDNKPAVELSFAVSLPNGYRYRGFVDGVLRHTLTGEVMVLECKTASITALNPAEYKNSAQAIGYSIVLDHLFPGLSSYQVQYLVYLTKSLTWEALLFNKSYLQRALWIQELLLDCEVITMYENAGVYPMRGESCFSWYRECEFMQTCTLSTALLTSSMTAEEAAALEVKEAQYQIVVTVEDLIRSQLAKDISEVPIAEINGDLLL